MQLGFSRRNAIHQSPQKTRRPATKRRRLFFDSLEDRRLLTAGTLAASGSEFQVNPPPATAQLDGQPSVASDSAGDQVVAWSQKQSNGNWNVMFQQYTNNAGILSPASPVTVASNLVGALDGNSAPRIQVARAPAGQFVVAWETNSMSGSYADTYTTHVRLYSASGNASGKSLVVGSDAFLMSVAMSNNGFDVLYGVHTGGKRNFNGGWMMTEQRYTSTGSAVGGAISIVSVPEHGSGSIAMDNNGDSVVAWKHDTSNTTSIIEAEPFNSAGATTAGGVIAVSGSAGVAGGTVAMDPTTGSFVVAWSQSVPAPGPGTAGGFDVYATQYRSDGTFVQQVTAAAAAPYSSILGLNGTTYYYEATPSPTADTLGVAALAGGAFDLSWQSDFVTLYSDPNQTSGYGATHHYNINVSTFNADGSQNQSFAVTSDGTSGGSTVALDGNNDLFVIWQDTGNIDGQFYLDPPASTGTSTAGSPAAALSPGGSTTAATDAVFAAYAYPEDDETIPIQS